ncbi:MAG: hypothetical protein ABW000_14975 [Actinoplanes sp.]
MTTGDERAVPPPSSSYSPAPADPADQPAPRDAGDEDVLGWHLRRVAEGDRGDGAASWDSAI